MSNKLYAVKSDTSEDESYQFVRKHPAQGGLFLLTEDLRDAFKTPDIDVAYSIKYLFDKEYPNGTNFIVELRPKTITFEEVESFVLGDKVILRGPQDILFIDDSKHECGVVYTVSELL